MSRADQDFSHAIRVTRVCCIFLMMFAHVLDPGDLLAPVQRSAGFEPVFQYIKQVASHVSVPLLSVVSGWLFVRTMKPGWSPTIRNKLRTLVVPLFLWNALMLAVYLAADAAFSTDWSPPATLMEGVNSLLAVTARPANRPLYFLRDVFVCAIVGLAVMRAPGRPLPWALAALIAGILLSVFWPQGPIMQRAVILPGFMTGFLIALTSRNVMESRFIPPWLIGAAFALLLLLRAFQDLTLLSRETILRFEGVIELATRLSLAILGWGLLRALSRAPLSRRIAALEPYVFFVFCSHFILFMVISAIVTRIEAIRQPGIVYTLFLIEPVIGMVSGIAGYRILAAVAPSLLGLLNGGRVQRRGRSAAGRTAAAV